MARVIPNFVFSTPPSSTGLVGRQPLADAAAEIPKQQITTAAAGEPEAIIYGRVRIGARIGRPIVYGANLLLPCFHGLGPIDAVEALEIDNVAPPTGVSRTDYLGGTSQSPHAGLVAAWAALGKSYGDTYNGRAYSVVSFPPGPEYGFNAINFIIRGKKVYDPRKRAPDLAGTIIFGGGAQPSQMNFGTGSFTLEAWFYHDNFTYPNTFAPIARPGATWNTARGFVFGSGSNASTVYFGLHDGATHFQKAITCDDGYRPSQLVGTWVHVAYVVDRATATAFLVVNGVKQTDTFNISGAGSFDSATGQGVEIGNSVGWRLDGRVAEFRAWNVARTGDQIRDLMFSRAAGTESGLVACYPFDEASGQTGNDITPFNADRTFTSVPSWAGRGPDLGPAVGTTDLSYSNTPALCLADLLASRDYGQGERVNWSSVGQVADRNEELVGTVPNQEKRRTIGLRIGTQKKVGEWIEILRAYAGAWIVYPDGRATLVADEAAAVSLALVPGDFVLDSLEIDQRAPEDVPTVVTVKWTNTGVVPWDTDAVAQLKLAGVDSGAIPARESVIEFPGCQSAGMAERECFRRLKQGQLCDVNAKIVLMDRGLKLVTGDVISLTDNEGFSAKQFRVLEAAAGAIGRPAVSLNEYDSGVYSNSTASAPENPDSSLPSPNSPVAPGVPTLLEELVQVQGAGLLRSRIFASWSAPVFPFTDHYRIEITAAGVLQQTGTSKTTEFRSEGLKEGIVYAVNVYTVSSTGRQSSAAQETILIDGKVDPPSDVTNFRVREIGGKVFAAWDLISDLDNDAYEIRYGLQSLSPSWDVNTTLLGSVPPRSNQEIFEGLPAGDFRFFIKARDGKRTASYPAGQYSENAAAADVTISLDTSLFLSETNVFTSETVINMSPYTTRPVAAVFNVTDFGDRIGFGHANTNNAVGVFSDLGGEAFSVPHSTPSPNLSSYTTNAYDFGILISATWKFSAQVYDMNGAISPPHSISILTSDDGSGWTERPGEQWSGEARFVKGKITTTGSMLVVRDASGPTITIDAVARVEDGQITTSASAPTQVTLNGKYTRIKSIQVTAEGASAAMALYDNVFLSPTADNTFDLYAFDDAGNQIAAPVSWTFKGV